MKFTHFHVHSQYSILDGAASIPGLIEKAKADGQAALALTDHGNMFGIKLFYDTCRQKGIKPILGCEAYVARVSLYNKEKPIDRSGEHLIILAKNLTGYLNLVKLCSTAFCDGFYYRPRIDKTQLEKHHEGLIISSACLGGEIDQKIMAGDLEGAEKAALWYKNLFGEDYYLEVMRHPAADPKQRAEIYDNQQRCIQEKIKIARKLNIKLIATNDVHFLNEEDAEAHDLLICLNTRKDIDDPTRMRYTRQEWFKTTQEMIDLFPDLPEAIENTQEITDKVEEYELDSDPLMPVFPIPPELGTEEEYRQKFSQEDLFNEFTRDEKGNVVLTEEEANKKIKKLGGYDRLYRIKLEADYLKELTMKGVVKRYGENPSPEIMERIIFELHIMKTMGFPGYFLIVQDFIQAARDMGVIVGPGRGSAAGSAVAYCLGITNIDPIKYDLLFERFLNPDRISLPDIDVDFDDAGRQQVLEWVTEKYGADKVSHIVTFGSMAAKMAIKDVARVLKLELSEANRLAKMVPEAPKMTLKKAYKENPDLEKEKQSLNPLISKTIQFAETLEGSIRQTGVHACGILISRDPLTDHIPIMPTEGESLMTTQYDGHFVEPIGLIKMDFLGLRTLSIIKTCLDNIKKSKHIVLNENEIPLDDEETFKLFTRGDTTGLFQFESPGMKKHLRALQPNRFEDLVGPEQSGYMMSVGYDMYLQLLEEAVLEQRGEKAPQRTECSADLTVSANLPESYIPSGEQRMDIYRRIAALRTAEQSQELLDELIDRYGEPPQPVLKLMDVALLRAEAVQIGVSDISQRGSEITFTFAASEAVPVEAVMALCSLPKNRRRLTLSATGTEPKLLLRLTPNEDALDTALTLVGDLRVNKEENEKEVTL